MKLRDIVLGSLLAVSALGCGMKRHYISDEFDQHYRCNILFSKDFKSDVISLYESGKKIGIREHVETKDAEGKTVHKVFYEFYEGDNTTRTINGRQWYFVEPVKTKGRSILELLEKPLL